MKVPSNNSSQNACILFLFNALPWPGLALASALALAECVVWCASHICTECLFGPREPLVVREKVFSLKSKSSCLVFIAANKMPVIHSTFYWSFMGSSIAKIYMLCAIGKAQWSSFTEPILFFFFWPSIEVNPTTQGYFDTKSHQYLNHIWYTKITPTPMEIKIQ